tara:strand:+ start:393 stop:1124 length:732 start_codon:yes stop_codon:yes gene_type:complete
MKKKYLLILAYLFTLTAFSQSINTDRPDQTEGSSTINKGTFQIETGILLSEDDNTNEKSLFLPSTLLRFGITDNIELRIFQEIEHKIYHSNTITGFNDLQLGLKLQLFKKENSATEIAFMSHINLPNSSDFFSNNRIGIINKLCISHPTNKRTQISYNIGYDYMQKGNGDITYSIVTSYAVNDKFNTYIEPYGEINELSEHLGKINLGFTYLIKENMQFDYSLGSGVNHIFNFTSIGYSVLFN